jgi:hypothetical protein
MSRFFRLAVFAFAVSTTSVCSTAKNDDVSTIKLRLSEVARSLNNPKISFDERRELTNLHKQDIKKLKAAGADNTFRVRFSLSFYFQVYNRRGEFYNLIERIVTNNRINDSQMKLNIALLERSINDKSITEAQRNLGATVNSRFFYSFCRF